MKRATWTDPRPANKEYTQARGGILLADTGLEQ